MPFRPPSICVTPGCSGTAVKGSRYCADCRPKGARSGTNKKFYKSAAHRRWRAAVLQRDPVCQCPNEHGRCHHEPGKCSNLSEHADHLVPKSMRVRDGRGLCPSCHSRKTAHNLNRNPDGTFNKGKWTGPESKAGGSLVGPSVRRSGGEAGASLG